MTTVASEVHPRLAAGRALLHAERLIRRGWTQGAYCRTKAGDPCGTSSHRIHRVDLAWAVERAARREHLPPEQLRQLVQAQLPAPYRADVLYGLERWNDQLWRSRSEVLLLLERVRGEL